MMVLTPEQQERAFELAISGDTLARIASELGFPNNMGFHRYRQAYPLFDKQFRAARHAGNELMEDQILTAADNYLDPQQARVKVDALARVLGYRDEKYRTNRVDINVNQTVDISGSLNRLQAQIETAYRDVTPHVIEAAIQKPNDSEELW